MARKSTKPAEILDFLHEFSAANGYPPSVREIGAAVGLKSTASVHYHLKELENQGLIETDENKNRTISLVGGTQKKKGQIPLLGVVTAGLPILAVEHIDGYIPWDGESDCFALRVRGESMIEAGILDGDIVVVRPQQDARNGDIVVALLDDEATVKRFSHTADGIWLLPENPAFEPIDGRFATILGKVKAVMRTY